MDEALTPLESLRCPYYNQTKGDLEELSVLDAKLCQDVHFPQYYPAPKIQPEMDPCMWQNWIESLSSMEKNLSWLLKLPHAKYWCQIVNNITLQAFLDSYLKQTPRFQASSWPDDVLEVHNSVHRLVFMVYIRMAANKESAKNFMTPDYFGELIYENFLFDIPKILDLCAVFGNKTNSTLLGKAISNVFKCQPGYNEDLKQSVDTVMQILQNIDAKCGVANAFDELNDENASTCRPYRLFEGSRNGEKLTDLSVEEFEDVVLYASDVSYTLRRFLVDVYPNACAVFYKKVKYLSRFYSTSLTILKNSVRKRAIDDLHLRSELLAHLKVARDSILNVVRRIVNECIFTPALRSSEVGDVARAESLADEYFHLLSELLEESKFFQDFKRRLPILEDVQSLLRSLPGIDETRASFILGSLGDGKTHRPNHVTEAITNGTDTVPSSSSSMSLQTVKREDVEMQSLVSTVHDVLPHLEDEFIRSCLLYYERDCEKTIHALLEGNIPDDLRVMDNAQVQLNESKSRNRNEASKIEASGKRAPSCEEEALDRTENLILKDRRNVFDNDEFDVCENETVDFSRIHKGKKTKSSTEQAAPTPEMRQMYEKYSMVYDEVEISEEMGALAVNDYDVYDDEYDDMYDGLGVDANDAGDTDDILNRRPFVTPRVFLQRKKENSSQSEESAEEEAGASGPKPDHFIANPAEVREKQEARRRQQQELKSGRRGGSRGQRSNEKSEAKPTGSTAQDRKRKDANKAKIANHNRKKMASRKAAKGMRPT